MSGDFLELIILSLAVFRLTRLLVIDQITSFIREPFHEIEEKFLEDGSVEYYINIKGKGIRRWIGELLSCFWCTGIWCTVLVFLGYNFIPLVGEPIVYILAIAGLAGIVEAIIGRY
jgi:hypothetical protein